jgi:hypothetical protein
VCGVSHNVGSYGTGLNSLMTAMICTMAAMYIDFLNPTFSMTTSAPKHPMILPIQGSEFIKARRVGGSVCLPLDPSSPKRSTNEGSACRDPKEPVSLWA